ncbi:histidine phosphatase family protein [Thiohalophilus sp.]|uniref:histidine phosphatase family protein n=1 Tax=Thiohalophilus sp. TaxID=3028392 RepID=UPI003974D6C0
MVRRIAALIRHADYQQLPDTPSAHQPFGLTDKGHIQAQHAASSLQQALDRYNWSLSPTIDSSPLLRAWQTAQVICQTLSGKLATIPEIASYAELAERSLGSGNNLSIADIEALMRDDPRYGELPADWKSNSHYRLPLMGAESLLQAGERVANHLQQRMADLANTSVIDTVQLFIGHGAAFRHAACQLQVLELDQVASLSMYHAQPIYLEYLPNGQWRHISGEWKVRTNEQATD